MIVESSYSIASLDYILRKLLNNDISKLKSLQNQKLITI